MFVDCSFFGVVVNAAMKDDSRKNASARLTADMFQYSNSTDGRILPQECYCVGLSPSVASF